MTQTTGKNPFRPGVGTKPLFLAGREAPMRRFAAMLRAAPEQPANMRLTGLRGVGKTVLLKEFERLALGEGWAVASTEMSVRHNREDALVTEMVNLAEGVVAKLSQVERLKRAVGKVVRGIREPWASRMRT